MKSKSAYQSGSSLVEVLVSLLILAVGLLGIIGMQAKALQLNNSAHLYSQAAFLANDMMESIRISKASANKHLTEFDEDAADLPDLPGCVVQATGCTDPEDIAIWNLHNWKNNIESLLPDGKGEVQSSTDGVYVITVQFRVNDIVPSVDGSENISSVSLTTGI